MVSGSELRVEPKLVIPCRGPLLTAWVTATQNSNFENGLLSLQGCLRLRSRIDDLEPCNSALAPKFRKARTRKRLETIAVSKSARRMCFRVIGFFDENDKRSICQRGWTLKARLNSCFEHDVTLKLGNDSCFLHSINKCPSDKLHKKTCAETILALLRRACGTCGLCTRGRGNPRLFRPRTAADQPPAGARS